MGGPGVLRIIFQNMVQFCLVVEENEHTDSWRNGYYGPIMHFHLHV